jgi:hypothetical protein
MWHDADKAGTDNLAQSPVLTLPLRGLVGEAVTSGRPVSIELDVTNHPLFHPEMDQRSQRCKPLSTLIIPLLLETEEGGEVSAKSIGAIQATNKYDGTPFNDADTYIMQQLAALASSCVHNNHCLGRQAQLFGDLCRICTSLDVGTILRHVVGCVREWSNNQALETRVWVRDPHDPKQLCLCALAHAGGSLFVKSHLAALGTMGRPTRARVCDTPDSKALTAYASGVPVMPQHHRRRSLDADEAGEPNEAVLYFPLKPSIGAKHGEKGGVEDAKLARGTSLGLLQVTYACGTLKLTSVEVDLLGQIAMQCSRALLNAENHYAARLTNKLYTVLLAAAPPMLKCRGSATGDSWRCECVLTGDRA